MEIQEALEADATGCAGEIEEEAGKGAAPVKSHEFAEWNKCANFCVSQGMFCNSLIQRIILHHKRSSAFKSATAQHNINLNILWLRKTTK